MIDRERSVHRAHGVIREFVRSASSTAGEDPAALVRLLRHTLPAHFAYEERDGGFFARLGAHGAAALLLDRLRAEHREFLDRLDRLEAAVARREDVGPELAAIAERLREHEWIESASAVQVGLHAPADPESEPDPAIRALPAARIRAVEALVDRVHALAAGNPDELLAAVTVAAPEEVQAEALRAVVEEALSRRGLDFVEISVNVRPARQRDPVEIVLCPGDGDLELQHTRFHRLR